MERFDARVNVNRYCCCYCEPRFTQPQWIRAYTNLAQVRDQRLI